MTPGRRLTACAALVGWAALALGMTASSVPGEVALVAALSVGLLARPGTRAARAVPLVVGLASVALVSGGVPVALAAAVGALVVVHVVLADLAADAVDASPRAVAAALRACAPALAVAAAAATALAAGSMLLPGPASVAAAAPALVLALAPLLLVAGLLALGLATRRPTWAWLPQRAGLAGLTRRYLDRAARRF